MTGKRLGILAGPALLAALAIGCGDGPPGAGITNGPEPSYAPEKPAVRDDLPPPDRPDADTAAGQPSAGPEVAGTGGARPAGSQPGGAGAPAKAPESPAGAGGADAKVRATPPRREASSGGDAAGATRPADNIQDGSPRSPQL